jgi:hypothetical protein
MFNLNANVIASMAKEEGAMGIEKSIHYQDYLVCCVLLIMYLTEKNLKINFLFEIFAFFSKDKCISY